MRKNLYYVTFTVLLTFLFICAGPVAIASGFEMGISLPIIREGSNNQINVDFFYDPSCESCQKVLPFIEQYEANTSAIAVNYYNTAVDNSSYDRFARIQKDLGNVHVHVPFVQIGNQYLVGQDNIISNLDTLIIEAKDTVITPGSPLREYKPVSSTSNQGTNEILFFYDPSCGGCQKVLPFIEQYAMSHLDIQINFSDISENQVNHERLHQIKSKYPHEKISVPVVFIGDTFLQGEVNITSSFNSTVEAYLKNSHSTVSPVRQDSSKSKKNNIIPLSSLNLSDPISSNNNQDLSGVQFFYNPSCGSCQKVLPFIEDYAKNHPNARINFNDISGNQTNIELFEKYRSMFPKETIHVPVVFLGDKLLQGEANITNSFNTTVESYLKNYSSTGLSVNQGLSDGVSSINPVVLLVAAIGEGLNPCGLLVLALLMVSLMATGTRKMVLFVGIAYICAFFLVRLLSGFALFSIIQLPGIANTFTLVAALIAIIAGVIQIKDGLTKKQKPLLSIPDSKKSLISSYMKKASIPGGFIVGVLVGIYGMACTAGIYISILSMLYKDLTSGVLYLALYNFIVIIPLIAILLLVFLGLPPEKVNTWREERKSQLRLLIGIVMILMGIIILIPMLQFF